jgi:hypothetical protein
LNARLENRIFGRFKGAALEEAFKIVRDNGGLDIGGEYGSLEISDSDFEADSKLQNQMNNKYESETCETDIRYKKHLKVRPPK